MREFIKSFSSLSLALTLLPIRQIENAFTPRGPGDDRDPAVKTMDSITKSVVDQFGGTLQATFSALDNVQRGIIALSMNALWPFPDSGAARHPGRHDHNAPDSRRGSSGDARQTGEQ